jgi:two-component system sensor histidine kinase and response regulator WspE
VSDQTKGESVDPVMLGLFKTELENHTRILEAGLVDLEKDQTPQRIEPLMRAAHSIKGAARIVGLDRAVRLAHVMEDVLSAVQRGTLLLGADAIDLLLAGNDVYHQLAVAQTASIPQLLERETEQIARLSDSLGQVLSGAAAESPAPTPSATGQRPTPEPLKAAPTSAAEAGEPERAAPAAAPATAEKSEESLVRVLAENLNRLMGLTGECLVQAKATRTFSSTLARIKVWQLELSSALESLYDWAAGEEELPEDIRARVMHSVTRSEQISDLLRKNIDQFELFSTRLEQLTDRLYSEVVATRMRPFSEGVFAFPRMVRDLAREKGKQVRFEIIGGGTRVDRDILEKLESPLTHLLRNAVDHGVENPEERVRQGKPPEALVTLEGRHSSGMLHVAVRDDGRGIDQEKIRKRVVENGYASEELAAKLNAVELLEFLFLPGFSTAEALTETSGRGVGLDVVQSMAKEVGGALQVDSAPGKGTTFHLRLPLTLSVLRTLVVEIASEYYAVPLTRIDRTVTASRENLQILEDRQFCTVDGEPLGLLEASQVLQLPVSAAQDARLHVLVVSDRLNRYGLVVSRFVGERDLVVLPLDARLGRVPNISAGAILEDGTPVLILDVDDVVRSIDNLVRHGRPGRIGRVQEAAETARKRVLIVDDSLTVREVERRLLENRGYEVVVAVDGMDGWNSVQTSRFDLVISDVDMPRLDGIELVRRIKSNPQLKAVPVMIVSYKDRDEDKVRGLDAGANYYLTKSSFDDETLIAAVRDLIGEPA